MPICTCCLCRVTSDRLNETKDYHLAKMNYMLKYMHYMIKSFPDSSLLPSRAHFNSRVNLFNNTGMYNVSVWDTRDGEVIAIPLCNYCCDEGEDLKNILGYVIQSDSTKEPIVCQ